ncbi:regulator of g signaling superfamily [Trichoderma arundinaceum]|uniref:Regulator of g signaling superfamily n=1 Tax=Trichoderma arundinaceum TaxID=490622 RepID=A0A395NZY4_TRIAR|nr:regulator of g signaling superfamily [Trichoderma arundinaceum]
MGSELGLTADSKPGPRLNGVGIWWICWATGWTLLLVWGMGFLLYQRRMPMLKIRGIGMSLCAITLLHLYWISVQLGYVLGPLYPGDTQYWIMGTYLPLGIGLFHASNTRFLYVAQRQKQYIDRANILNAPITSKSSNNGGAIGRFRRLDHTTKVVVLVGSGMFFQLFMAIFMYLISRKWHSSWGIPGTEVHGTEMEQKVQMGRGWEWWPSVLWLFFWAWIVAPSTLWRARDIRDTQGWRTQTIWCAISGLHAAPMWLIALYVPGMEAINHHWIPPQWIAISIWLMEIFTVFLPCWEVLCHQALCQETLNTIAQWENNKTGLGKAIRSFKSKSTIIESIKTGWKSTNSSIKTSSVESILTLSALEYVLERNPEPLQQFSALRDFSGENIAFLTSVGEWKSSFPASVRNRRSDISEETRWELVRERFNRALRIYTEYISASDAAFPINISSVELKKLESVFEAPARSMYGEKQVVNPATPFNFPEWSKPGSVDSSCEAPKSVSEKDSVTGDCVQYWGDIPDGFDQNIFDDAEKSIKYLVLTNTWPKFVRDRRDSMESFENTGSTEAGGSLCFPISSTSGDVPAILELVRSAYRGDSSRAGWTTEADLVNDQRIDEKGLLAKINEPFGAVLVTHDEAGELLACCELLKQSDTLGYFGLFAVNPLRQAGGIGRKVLAEAEAYAKQTWGLNELEMSVIWTRDELIQWYIRRGYTKTEKTKPFPYGQLIDGKATRDDLYFSVLVKAL